MMMKMKKGIITDDGDEDDRISNLPESLIHHILSFLLMRDVTRTCLLSKRWRNIWKSAPVLSFGKMWLSINPSKDNEIIEQSLVHFEEGRKVKTLQFHIDEWNAHRLESWVRFAVNHGVEELDLSSSCCEYMLPSCLFECLEMRVLTLWLDDWTPRPFRFPLLTELHFMGFSTPTYLDTSGCPLLQVLSIEYPYKTLNIYAPNPKLRYLKISDYDYDYACDSSLTLYAPNLLYFELQRGFTRFYEIKDLSSVKTADIQSFEPVKDGMAQSLVALLRNLTHVKSLKLCQSCIQMLAYGETIGLKIPSLSATCLELTTNLSRPILVGIASLLRASHCIEQLIINMERFAGFGVLDFQDHVVVKTWELLEHALLAELPLDTVLIQNYLGCQHDLFNEGRETNMEKFLEYCDFEIKLVEVLLKSSKVLKKMDISIMKLPSQPLKLQFLDGLTKKLLVFPRASENAEVYLS